MKFSPAPWSLVEHSGALWIADGSPARFAIASLVIPGTEEDGPTNTDRANGELMVRAPELLNIARMLLQLSRNRAFAYSRGSNRAAIHYLLDLTAQTIAPFDQQVATQVSPQKPP